MDKNFRLFILFWLSQSVSQLGSSMTSFALIVWAYTKTGSAMSVSLMTFCNYLPYVVVSLFAGSFVDRHYKKHIMLISDLVAAICSLCVLVLWQSDQLTIGCIYVVNGIIGLMNAFQSPAEGVAIGILVPKDQMSRASGMSSLSGQFITIVAPILAPAILAVGGLGSVIAVDLISFLFAFVVLLVAIHIPEHIDKQAKKETALAGCLEGFSFLKSEKGLFQIIVTMAFLNFVSRLTYENILSPMLLSRSGDNMAVLGFVQGILGAGGIIGGLIISLMKVKIEPIKMIYYFAAASFLGGDLLMGLGQNVFFWSLGGILASFPIPFIMAGQQVILYERIPREIQGKVFALRNAIQFSTIPLGILLGGFLADQVFEPFMASEHALAQLLSHLVGTGKGSGMAVMFLITGLCGSLYALWAYHSKEIQGLKQK